MSFDALLVQEAVLTHRATTGAADAEGNTTFAAPTTTTLPCLLQQTSSVEVLDGEERAISDLVLFLPAAAAALSFEDEVTVDGTPYLVQGDPDVFRTRRGVHHVEARVKKVG